MKFAFLFYEAPAEFANRDTAEGAEYHAAWMSYMQAMAQTGIMQGGEALLPPTTATAVRFGSGKSLVQDGPYADTKEQLGGFVIVEVDNLDAALAWAARAPCADGGAVEVRPVWEMR